MRPSWDKYFTDIVEIVKTRSTCKRRQIGALIVKDKRILSTGYNGAPSGISHCEDAGCLRDEMGIPSGQRHELCRGLHAEQNAIVHAALHGISIKDATIYVTHQPCIMCAKMIINSGITTVVFKGDYPDQLSVQMLEEAKINLVRYQE